MGKSERLQGCNDHVCTPEIIWGPIVKHFGPIALDPFSNPKSRVPAKVKITNWTGKLPKGWTHGNGLEEAWTGWDGPVFLNGEYSKLKPWMAQAYEDAMSNRASEIFLFVPTRTSGSAWQKYGFHTDAVCHLNFRVKHDYEDSTSPFHQSLLYYGPRASHFLQVFGVQLGYGTVDAKIRESIYQRWPISADYAKPGKDADEDDTHAASAAASL